MILGLPIKYRDAQNQPYRDGYLIDTSVKNVGPNGLNLVAYAAQPRPRKLCFRGALTYPR